MIRPARLIRRTALIVANLTPDPILARVASIGCWLRRDAYFAGAEAAIRGDELPFNLIEFAPAVDGLRSVRQAFAECIDGMERDARSITHPSLSRELSDDNLARVIREWSIA